MKKLGLACLLLLLVSTLSLAKNDTHQCKVSLIDFNVDDGSTLGAFKTQIVSDKPITKAYRFPGTRLFVTTSVLYMQAFPYREASPPVEMILTLVLGKKPYSNIENEMRNLEVLSIARAVVPLKSFEVSKVETIYLGKRQPIIITLECNK
jgi:hypothetical protein